MATGSSTSLLCTRGMATGSSALCSHAASLRILTFSFWRAGSWRRRRPVGKAARAGPVEGGKGRWILALLEPKEAALLQVRVDGGQHPGGAHVRIVLDDDVISLE